MLETITKYYDNESMFHGFIPHIMGTRFDMLIIHSSPDRLNHIWSDITNELEGLDKLLNRFDPASEVARLNALQPQAPILISKELENILQLSQYYYENTLHLLISHSKIFPYQIPQQPIHLICSLRTIT